MEHSEYAQLLQRCADKDQAAWRSLVAEFTPLIFAIGRRSGLTDDNCEEAAQAVFTALWKRLESIRDARALTAWITTAARRECWKLARAAGRHASSEAAEPAAELAEPEAERLERHFHLHRALEELGDRCRALLNRLYLLDPPATYEQISLDLNMPVGSIGPTRRRCLERLAELLGEESAFS